MAAVGLMALAAPVAMVVFSLRSFSGREAGSDLSTSEAAAPLEKALEDIADRNLAPAGLGDDQPRLEIRTDRPEEVLVRVEALLAAYGASALPPERTTDTIRLVGMIRADQVADFFAACRAEDPGRDSTAGSSPGTGGPNDTRTLVEIVIQKNQVP